jgi:nucleoside-diphosphate-sugar epimerase
MITDLNQRILIIGGTRFIGPHVVARLAEMGCEVAVFHRGRTHADLPAGVQRILGDRQYLADHIDEFRCLAPQVVLDMIPITERDAQVVLRTFRGIARRIVAISSQDVYRAYGRLLGVEAGPVDSIPLTEAAPLRTKLYPYRGEVPREAGDPRRWMDDYDKILVERTILGDPHLVGTVLRLPMFEYLKRMDDGRPVILLERGLARWRWTRGYVENVAAAIALAVTDERASGQVYNVGEAEALSMADWVRRIGAAAGWGGQVVVVSGERLPDHLRPDIHTEHHLVTASTRIREELGYGESVPQDEALRRTVAWERAHPPEKIDPGQFDYAAEDAVLAELTLEEC